MININKLKILFFLKFSNNCYCNCCCCKNNKIKKNNDNNIKNDDSKDDDKIEFLKKEDIEKLIDPSFNLETKKDVFEKDYNKYKNNLEKVKELLKTTLNYNYSNDEPHFPHIHWNGGVNNSYKHLCFMIAPLNVLLHLDKIKEFFKSKPKTKIDDNKLKDISEVHNYLYNEYWIDVFRLYVDRLENGHSFTLDPQKDKDGAPENIYLLGLVNKADSVESIEVSSKFFDSIVNKYIHNYKFLNIRFHDYASVNFNSDSVEYKKILDEFIKIQNGKEDSFDIIYLDTQYVIDDRIGESFKNQKTINNIKEIFKYSGNTYHLDGLVYFGTNSNKLKDGSNDCFSFVFDKNAPDKNKPYVYCQLNSSMKYYSLKEIEEGMKPNKTNISSYKYHHLIAIAYSKTN